MANEKKHGFGQNQKHTSDKNASKQGQANHYDHADKSMKHERRNESKQAHSMNRNEKHEKREAGSSRRDEDME